MGVLTSEIRSKGILLIAVLAKGLGWMQYSNNHECDCSELDYGSKRIAR